MKTVLATCIKYDKQTPLPLYTKLLKPFNSLQDFLRKHIEERKWLINNRGYFKIKKLVIF